jgi:hypothetical protein
LLAILAQDHNELEADHVTALISRLRSLFLHIDSGVEDSRNWKVLQFLKNVESISQCPLRCISSKWIDSAELKAVMDGLKHDASEDRRTVLLVSGLHLEDQVTVCTLEALLEGFDVHLLCDVIFARETKLKPVLLLRLFQAGAVPSSLRQFLYMWLAAETDPSMTQALRGLLEDYDVTFSVHPA